MEDGTVALDLERTVATAARPSRRVCEAAAMFGLGVDERRVMRIVPRTRLRLGPGRVVFITGASGGGKSALLGLIHEAAAARSDARVLDLRAMDAAGDRPLVESFDDIGPGATGERGGLEQAPGGELGGEPGAERAADPPSLGDAVRWLTRAGLGDAFVMLRRAEELSDGQRDRLRLARVMAAVERGRPPQRGRRGGGAPLTLVLADEFGATLDRQTAKGLARNVRKWTRRPSASGSPGAGGGRAGGGGVCFVAATSHDDLLEALEPDTLIVQHPGEAMEVMGNCDLC